jgi:hypothetical protein
MTAPSMDTQSGRPSPLEGEGARRADEGLPATSTDEAVLADLAQRDLTAKGRAASEWRTPGTKRLRGFARRMRAAPTEAERRLDPGARPAPRRLQVSPAGPRRPLHHRLDVRRASPDHRTGRRSARRQRTRRRSRPLACGTGLPHASLLEYGRAWASAQRPRADPRQPPASGPTPHPAAARPPSPSRGEGQGTESSPSGRPSPLEGEGARRADEGLPATNTKWEVKR